MKVPLRIIVFSLLLGVLFFLPGKSQWLAGGWDPGTYLNQGIQLARHHQFSHSPDVQTVPDAFLHTEGCYQELFPGFPYEDGKTGMYFFKLQGIWIGLLYVLGGVDMAAQAGLLAGLIGLLVWSMLFYRLWGGWGAGIGALLFLLHPIWVYHLDLPLPELLQITLMGCLFWVMQEKKQPWLIALILFLMTVNRITFFLFGSWWLAFYAATQRIEKEQKDWVLVFGVLGLSAGLILDLLTTPYVDRLQHVLPRMIQAGCGGWVIAGCICIARCRDKLTPRFAILLPAFILFIAGCKMGGLPSRADWLPVMLDRGNAWIAFTGRIYVLFFVISLLLFLRRVWHKPDLLSAFGLWLIAGSWMWWSYPHIANLYPWATRRMLLFGVPLMVLVITWAASLTWKSAQKHLPWFGTFPLTGMALIFLCLQTPNAIRAWQPAEFSGMKQELEEVAQHLPTDGLVISDHFRWAVPLWCLHDHFMLNGENFRLASEEEKQVALDWLKEFDSLYLFTSTEKGPAYLGELPGSFELLYEGQPVHYQQLHHHAELRRYALRDMEKQFRIYRWRISAPLENGD